MPLSEQAKQEVESFIETVHQKTQRIVEEFAAGEISREQFHHLYERYTYQLDAAHDTIQSGSINIFYSLRNTESSMAIRSYYQGKARGLLVFHHQSSSVLEILGEFGVPLEQITRKLKDIAQAVINNHFVDWEVTKIGDSQWLLFEPGKYTTVVTLFQNEPSAQQSSEIDRMHRDFENANRTKLEQKRVNSYQLAYPFIAFVQKKPAQD